KGNAQMIPGWPYSWVAALEPGRTSWTLPLDAVRLGPQDDPTEVTAAQLREVTGRIIAAGQWHEGDPDILVVLDSGYDLARMAWGRMHQRLEHRGAWEDHEGGLPVIEGTLIRLQVDHLPGQRTADPVWLWSSRAVAAGDEVNRAWQAFLRRFDIEHTFRFLKQ